MMTKKYDTIVLKNLTEADRLLGFSEGDICEVEFVDEDGFPWVESKDGEAYYMEEYQYITLEEREDKIKQLKEETMSRWREEGKE